MTVSSFLFVPVNNFSFCALDNFSVHVLIYEFSDVSDTSRIYKK